MSHPAQAGQPHTRPLPSKIAQAAAARRLGALVLSRKGSNPLANAAFALVAAGVLFGLALGLGWLSGKLGFLRYLSILSCAASVAALFFGALALAAGFTATYVFEHGLVHTKNGRVRAVAWPEVAELRLHKGGKSFVAGKILAYYVMTTDGRKIGIEAKADGPDEIGEHLQWTVRAWGRPVVDSGPGAGMSRPG